MTMEKVFLINPNYSDEKFKSKEYKTYDEAEAYAKEIRTGIYSR